MPDEETLLSNRDGTITVRDGCVLVCDCPGDSLDLAVRRVSTFAFVAAGIIAGIVAARAAPWPILLIAITWSAGAIGARVVMWRRQRLHGRTTFDFERQELLREQAKAAQRAELAEVVFVSTPLVAGEGAEEPGLSPRWILLHLRGGRCVRLGKGPAYALGPTLAFLKRAGIETRGERTAR